MEVLMMEGKIMKLKDHDDISIQYTVKKIVKLEEWPRINNVAAYADDIDTTTKLSQAEIIIE